MVVSGYNLDNDLLLKRFFFLEKFINFYLKTTNYFQFSQKMLKPYLRKHI